MGSAPDILHANVYEAGVRRCSSAPDGPRPVVVTEHASDFVRRRLPAVAGAEGRRFAFSRAAARAAVSRTLQSAIDATASGRASQVSPTWWIRTFSGLEPNREARDGPVASSDGGIPVADQMASTICSAPWRCLSAEHPALLAPGLQVQAGPDGMAQRLATVYRRRRA